MGGFAIVTYKGVVFDTDCGKAIFGVGPAIGAGCVAGLTGEVFDGCFGGCWHGCCGYFMVCGCGCIVFGGEILTATLYIAVWWFCPRR